MPSTSKPLESFGFLPWFLAQTKTQDENHIPPIVFILGFDLLGFHITLHTGRIQFANQTFDLEGL